MNLSKQEIKFNLNSFIEEWKDATKENASSQSFWNELFESFGLKRRKYARFEKKVKKFDGGTGRIDVFWEGILLAEQKSKGKSLDEAMIQAKNYLPNLPDHEAPRFILICDFENFVFEDLDLNIRDEFLLSELPNKIDLLSFFTGFEEVVELKEVEVSRKATEILTKMYNSLKKENYEEEELMTFIVRLMFCLFAEDAEIFYKKNALYELVKNHSKSDGSDLGALFTQLFLTLNKPSDKRSKNLPNYFKPFEYVNGTLFEKNIEIPSFNKKMRNQLIECCKFNWSKVSPVIFGSMFQNISGNRDKNGVHYTSYDNIRKVIDSLFLDQLYDEFENLKKVNSLKEYRKFHKKISNLTFLDPACGCGNFLVTIYQELRLLETELLVKMNKLKAIQLTFEVSDLSKIKIDNFYGIELLNFPAKVAKLSMWLIDHLMNLKLGETFGKTYKRLPLNQPLKILAGNALQQDWKNLINPKDLNYIVGNPPFIGSKRMSASQRKDIIETFGKVKKVGILDYVSGWFWKSGEFFDANSNIKIGLVSTNSITMGEQVDILWKPIFEKFTKIKFLFAHRTFNWSNKAKDNAAVHCVIIGMSSKKDKAKNYIFDYDDIKGPSKKMEVNSINPYLIDYKFLTISSRRTPLSNVPEMNQGNMPLCANSLILESDDDKNDLISKEPSVKKFIKPLVSSKQILHNVNRYCIWLVGATPKEIKNMPHVRELIKEVKTKRLASKDPGTRSFAETPHLFRDTKNPQEFILIPRHSTENRRYVPMVILNENYIPSDSCSYIWSGSKYIFGVVHSRIHLAWIKQIGGKIKSDYRYSKDIVYNNFPFPINVSDNDQNKVVNLVDEIMNIRNNYYDSSLADLYDEFSPATDLIKAHKKLDDFVESLYRDELFTSDKERIEYLFRMYEKMIK